MKITKKNLEKLIKEEIENLLLIEASSVSLESIDKKLNQIIALLQAKAEAPASGERPSPTKRDISRLFTDD